MGKKAKNLCKIGAVYLGTVIGAGFASGQELTLFFVRFSRRGLSGCLLAGGLFCFFGAIVLAKTVELPEKTFRCYLRSVFIKPVAVFLECVTELFLCISFCVMLSGSGAFFKEHLSLPPFVGILVMDLICLCVFIKDVKGLSVINLILTPLMLLGTVYVCLYSILAESRTVFSPQINEHARFLPYALFYVGYNMLTATAVLVPTGELADDRRTAAAGGILGGAGLTVMAFLCCLALYFGQDYARGSLPMLMLSARSGAAAHGIYAAVVYMAMLTTAVSAGFSAMQSLYVFSVKKKTAALFVCVLALPLSFVEFSLLIQYCYVFFGVLGVVLLWGIFWDWYQKK